jgi:hypothetical protein
MKANASLSRNPHFEGFVASQIAGRHNFDDESVPWLAGWTRGDLRAEIQKGLDSGPSRAINIDELLKKFKAERAAKLRANGEA